MYGISQQLSYFFEKLGGAGGSRLLRAFGLFLAVPAIGVACLVVIGNALTSQVNLRQEQSAAAVAGPPGQDADRGDAKQRARAVARAGLEDAVEVREGPSVARRAAIDVLDEADAKRYQQIFTLQRDGGARMAALLGEKLGDRLLVGHIEADRLLRSERPSYEDLSGWLAENRSHPDAVRLFDAAREVKPKRAKSPPRPLVENESLRGEPLPPPPHWSKRNNTKKQRKRVRYLKRTLRIWYADGEVKKAEKVINRRETLRLFDQYELDEARTGLAGAFYYKGEYEKAYDYAAEALKRSAKEHPIAFWTAGLAAWRLDRFPVAAQHFADLARRTDVSIWSRSGAAFWAARAYSRIEKPREARHWMREAAAFPMTVYGQLAQESLGNRPRFATRAQPPDREVLRPLLRFDRGRRAMALLQIGEVRRAEHELLGLKKWQDPDVIRALFSLGAHGGMPALAAKLAKRLPDEALSDPGADQIEAGYFPIPPWRALPESRVDRALLYAVMRQESSFYTLSRSPVGAQGLMQIMPQTAKDLSTYSRFRKKTLDRYDPETSVALGQTYLEQIMRQRSIGDDLIKIIAAYNAGIGNVRHWHRRLKDIEDPLLYMESLPSLETRLFVRRVLTNFWIYRARLEQERPTLAEVARGTFPKYRQLDDADPPLIGRVRILRGAPSARNGHQPAG